MGFLKRYIDFGGHNSKWTLASDRNQGVRSQLCVVLVSTRLQGVPVVPIKFQRKSNNLIFFSSVAGGLLLTVFLFATTWAFGVLAYIKTPDVALPDFYPVFQVSSSHLQIEKKKFFIFPFPSLFLQISAMRIDAVKVKSVLTSLNCTFSMQ